MIRFKTGKKDFFMLKVDMEKVHDKVRWDFLKDTHVKVGLLPGFINVILNCVTSSSMQILWNGELIDTFFLQEA